LSPLQAAQKRFLHLKHRKSNTVTGVEQVGFAHTSMASVDEEGIEDQNAPLELGVVAGVVDMSSNTLGSHLSPC